MSRRGGVNESSRSRRRFLRGQPLQRDTIIITARSIVFVCPSARVLIIAIIESTIVDVDQALPVGPLRSPPGARARAHFLALQMLV